MKDAADEIVTYKYDKLGRRIEQIDPLTGENSWIYDAVGNVVSSNDQLSRTTSSFRLTP